MLKVEDNGWYFNQDLYWEIDYSSESFKKKIMYIEALRMPSKEWTERRFLELIIEAINDKKDVE